MLMIQILISGDYRVALFFRFEPRLPEAKQRAPDEKREPADMDQHQDQFHLRLLVKACWLRPPGENLRRPHASA
jgi:hypothetical protein